MPAYLLHHRHDAAKCGVAFSAFKGHQSPLRHSTTFASCAAGGHEVWWVVEAESDEAARSLLPHYIAERCEVVPVRRVRIP